MSDKKKLHDAWIQGYACALATIIRNNHGPNTDTEDAFRAAGGMKGFRGCEVDPYDMKQLKLIQRRRTP